MTINWWTLGLQAVNVLILVWLLSRVFWRPVAEAIARRQDVVQTMLNDAKTAHDSAAAALAEVGTTRAGMAAEREALLSEATRKAEAAAKAALADASRQAKTLFEGRADHSRTRDRCRAGQGCGCICRACRGHRPKASGAAGNGRGSGRVSSPCLSRQSTRCRQRIARRCSRQKPASICSARSIVDAAAKAKVANAVGKALGGAPELNFVTDPDLIAGFELRTPRFRVAQQLAGGPRSDSERPEECNLTRLTGLPPRATPWAAPRLARTPNTKGASKRSATVSR